MFEIANTNNEMMPSVLSNILGWPGGNSSKRVRLIHMHASILSHWHNQHKLSVVCSVDQSQTSIQHPCDFMNMKENLLFLRNE